MYHVDWSLWIKITMSERSVWKRFCGEFWVNALKEDIQLAAGPLQTATGLQSGTEGAIHNMRCMFEDDRADTVSSVDARNAFNSLNRQAALHNVQDIYPQIATILVNTYRRPARLIILGASDIYFLEDTTQDDNLAMAFYALGTTLLVNTLQITSTQMCQMCLEGDISGAGSLGKFKYDGKSSAFISQYRYHVNNCWSKSSWSRNWYFQFSCPMCRRKSHEMVQWTPSSCRLCKDTTACGLFSFYTRYLKSIYILYANDTRHARIHKTCWWCY